MLKARRVVFIWLVIMAFVLLLSPRASHAQFTASFQTNIISGVFSNWTGDYNIGNNTIFDQLQIINGGVLSNNGYGEISLASSASGNSALVAGPGSLWSNTNTVFVGDGGSGSVLTVAGGGRVVDTYGYIGNAVNSSKNSVLVTSSGSVWSNSLNLYVGVSGFGNSLTISNGGQVFNENGRIGLDASATNNSVVVTGTGSFWTNSVNLRVGDFGSKSSLAVSDTGRVFSAGICMVGVYSSGNLLTVATGGQLISGSGNIGFDSSTSSNSVLVTGPGSVWNIRPELEIGDPGAGELKIGDGGTGNSMVITNGGRVFDT